MRISDWSSDVCSSDLRARWRGRLRAVTRSTARPVTSFGQLPAAATERDGCRRYWPAPTHRHPQRRVQGTAMDRAAVRAGTLKTWRRLHRRQALSPANPGTGQALPGGDVRAWRSEEHTSELQSLMRISYSLFCCKKKKQT